ncbi:MAG: hypothetical protein VX899_21910 [Myxococcota bacterium]|nr:hypothetical protein [Myxococcota bacterium]
MKRAALSLAVLSTAALSGCLPGAPGSELTENLPDERLLINMPVQDGAAKAAGEWSQAYLFTASTTRSINGLTGFVLGMVDTITDYPASYVDGDQNHAVWGPWSDALDPVDTLLSVQLQDDGSTSWQFQQKPKGADDSEYVAVIVGEVDAGSTREVHSGRFYIDFDMINALDPNQSATGEYAVDYEVDEEGVRGEAAFNDFQDGAEPVDALYRYDQVHEGEGSMDLGWTTAGADEEAELLYVVRSRWTEVGEGRSDALVTGGELGDNVALSSECWDTSFSSVYKETSWQGVVEGEQGACAFAEAEYPEE